MQRDDAEPFPEFRLRNQRKQQVALVCHVGRAADAKLQRCLSHVAALTSASPGRIRQRTQNARPRELAPGIGVRIGSSSFGAARLVTPTVRAGFRDRPPHRFWRSVFGTFAAMVKLGSTTFAIWYSAAWPMKVCAPRSVNP